MVACTRDVGCSTPTPDPEIRNVIYEKHHLPWPDQVQRSPVFSRRVDRLGLVDLGSSGSENRRPAGDRHLVLLPVLLLRLLRHPTLRGRELPVFRVVVVWPIPCSATKTPIATGANWIE